VPGATPPARAQADHRNEKETFMNPTVRSPLFIALAAGVVVLLGSTAVLFQRYQKTSADFTAMKTEEEMARHRYGQAINEIATIQDSLNAIVLGEESARLTYSQLQSEQNLSGRGDEALEQIAVLKAGIQRTKERIQELDTRIKESGVKVAGLQKMIGNLKKSVTAKEQQIAELNGQVTELQTRVTGLTTEVEQNHTVIQTQAATIEDSRRELGTIYYAIGTKKDLRNAGLVEAKGGLLGLGKTLEASGQSNESAYTPMDTDQQTVIRIPAEKAKVLSDQPVTSYQLAPVGKELELRILDPKQFRTVKHVVILMS
jgi:predicted  nucleic acid-binding Zn-ribbon protein